MTDFPDHFSSHAKGYAASRPVYAPSLASALARSVRRHEHVWDAGCGSGQLSVLLAMHFTEVSATDASAAQIENAVPNPRVTYAVEPAEQTSIEPQSVDLCTVAQSAHWFDRERYFDEVRRVTRPGGAVALITYGIMTIDSVIDPILVDGVYHELLRPYWPAERKHVETAYRAFAFPFDEERINTDDLTQSWTRDQLWDYVMTWSAVRKLEADGGRSKLKPYYLRLLDAWPDNEVRTVMWPLTVRLGRVR